MLQIVDKTPVYDLLPIQAITAYSDNNAASAKPKNEISATDVLTIRDKDPTAPNDQPLTTSHSSYPGGHVKSRPPSMCRCRWNTDCPDRGPTLYTVRYPSSMPRSRAIFAAINWL